MNNNRKVLLLLVMVFVLFRLSLLLSGVDYSDMYEERPLALFAHDVSSHNLRLPVMSYYYTGGHGGHIISAFIYVPFFYLFGDSLFVLKLAVLLVFSLPALILWYLFLEKYSGKAAAVCFSLLYIFSPPYFSLNNMIGWGLHTEMSLFYILFLLLLAKLIYEKNENGGAVFKPLLTLLMGFTAGLSFFYGYSFAAILAASIVSIYILKRKYSFLKFVVFLAILFPAGMGVLLYKIFVLKRYIVNVQGKPFVEIHSIGKYLSKLAEFIIAIPDSLYFRFWDNFSIKANFAAYEYSSVFFIALTAVIYMQRNNIIAALKALLPKKELKLPAQILTPELLILISIASFVSMVLVSAFTIPDFIPGTNVNYNKLNFYRYLLPFFPFMFAVMALFFSRMWESEKKAIKYASIIVLSANLLYCFAANVRLVEISSVGGSLIKKGYTMYGFYPRAVNFAMNESSELRFLMDKFDCCGKDEKYEVYYVLGNAIGGKDYNLHDVIKEVSRKDEMTSIRFMEGFFEQKAFYWLSNNKDISGYVDMADSIADPKYQRICVNRLGFVTGNFKKFKDEEIRIFPILSQKYAEMFAEGFGEAMVKVSLFYGTIYELKEAGNHQSIPPKYLDYYYFGIGRGIGRTFSGMTNSFYEIDSIPSQYRSLYYKYLGSYILNAKGWVRDKGYAEKEKVREGIVEKADELFDSSDIKRNISRQFGAV